MGIQQGGVSEQSVIRRTHAAAPRTTHKSDFTELAARIQRAGLMRRRYGYYWAKLVLLPLSIVVACVVFVWIGDTWWQLFTAVVFGVLFTQVAFLGHDAAHRQIFVSGRWNDWISLIIGDLFIGMSYGWWRHKHTRHHANPNKEGVDPDLERFGTSDPAPTKVGNLIVRAQDEGIGIEIREEVPLHDLGGNAC